MCLLCVWIRDAVAEKKDVQGEKLETPVSTGTHYLVKTSSDGGNWIKKRCGDPGLMGKKVL